MTAGPTGNKDGNNGNIVQDLVKNPMSVMDPSRWRRLLEVR